MNPGLAESDFSAGRLLGRLRDLALAEGLWLPRHYAKGQILFDQDNASEDVWVLVQGLVKLVYVTPDGEERIKSFIVDQGLFAAEDGQLAFGARTLEPCQIARLPRRWVDARIAEDAELVRAYGQFTDWIRRRKAKREQSLLCASAAERFQDMRRHEPDLMNRLAQGDIARFLGITPIAFSRIKRRIGN